MTLPAWSIRTESLRARSSPSGLTKSATSADRRQKGAVDAEPMTAVWRIPYVEASGLAGCNRCKAGTDPSAASPQSPLSSWRLRRCMQPACCGTSIRRALRSQPRRSQARRADKLGRLDSTRSMTHANEHRKPVVGDSADPYPRVPFLGHPTRRPNLSVTTSWKMNAKRCPPYLARRCHKVPRP